MWDGEGWRQAAAAGPPPRSGHAMAYDAGRRRVVLYGGGSFDGRTVTRHEDLWEWDGARWAGRSFR